MENPFNSKSFANAFFELNGNAKPAEITNFPPNPNLILLISDKPSDKSLAVNHYRDYN